MFHFLGVFAVFVVFENTSVSFYFCGKLPNCAVGGHFTGHGCYF